MGAKTQNGHFRCKIALRWKKVHYKVSLCENCRRQSCKAFIGLTICAKMNGGASPSTWNFESNWQRWSKIADFLYMFARSASPVTLSEKVQLTLIGSPISPRWTSYVVPKAPKGAQKAKCPKFEQQAAITPKRYEIGCQLLLITNRKSRTSFQLIPTGDLDDLEWPWTP